MTTISQLPPPKNKGLINRLGEGLLGEDGWVSAKKSWRTTAAGVGTIVISLYPTITAIAHNALTLEAALPTIVGVVTGAGLIVAKDGRATHTK